MRELTKMVAQGRTITGHLKVRSSPPDFGLVMRSVRMIDQIAAEYGLNILHGDLGCGSPFSYCTGTTIPLTITGLEQAEIVPQKWARALAAVSTEYGLDCTWEEKAVSEGGERGKFSSLTMTMEGSADGVSWHKGVSWYSPKFAQVGMSGMMGNQVRYLVEQAREREKMSDQDKEIRDLAHEFHTAGAANTVQEAEGTLRGFLSKLSTPTPKAAEAMGKLGIQFPHHGHEISISPDEANSGMSTEAVPSTFYADTPTGTVEWDEADGAALRRRIEGNPCEWSSGENYSLFSKRLHLTTDLYNDDMTDPMCPCCGSGATPWPRFDANNVGELLTGRYPQDQPQIEMLKAGISCKCGVRSTYDFDNEAIKLELVK